MLMLVSSDNLDDAKEFDRSLSKEKSKNKSEEADSDFDTKSIDTVVHQDQYEQNKQVKQVAHQSKSREHKHKNGPMRNRPGTSRDDFNQFYPDEMRSSIKDMTGTFALQQYIQNIEYDSPTDIRPKLRCPNGQDAECWQFEVMRYRRCLQCRPII